ncbi:hypothetical protein C2G38_2251439 [Gigaspora rosea]|uniref:Uncharacterized protein n=1 Tax=Gigaspora rosea TaxID=44941 RepID=A0A397UPM6_9GLOM|nr:hypothetical protein C2G38_2251439 [Gigaspora rosea]
MSSYAPIISKSFKKNQCKKELHAIKKVKIKKPNNLIIGKDDFMFNSSTNQIEKGANIFYDPLKAQKSPLDLYGIPEVLQKHPNNKLIIADETTKKVAGASETVQNIVDQYYNHALSSPSHRSNQFAKDLIEHFGCFTNSNNGLYVITNTAFTQCKEHRKCVRELIQELQPISDAVNNYFGIIYPTLYTKMKKLNLGPNVPKSFEILPMKFGSLFDDCNLSLEENSSKKEKKLQKYVSSKLGSQNSGVKLKNHCRSHLDFEPAKRGLPEKYKNIINYCFKYWDHLMFPN